MFIPGIGGGRSCLHPTGLFRSLFAAGLPGHLQNALDIRIAGDCDGVKVHALAEILAEGLGKALAGFFHLNDNSFPDRYRCAA